MDAVLSCMVTDSLGPGSLADQLTAAVAEYIGLAGGVALRERARALGMALDELGLQPGASVLLDPLLPHSYDAAIRARGLKPLYADVLDSSLCLDPASAERAAAACVEAGGSLGAVISHSNLGFVPDVPALAALGFPLIEDVSDGIGANTGDDRLGRFGRFVIVAMEPDHVVTAGGGTLLLASSRNDRAALRRAAEQLSADTLLPDMNAALGLTQIREIEKYLARRSEIAAVYMRALMRGRHRAPVQPGEAQNVYLSFPVLVEGSVAEVTAYCRKKGVETGPAFAESILDRYGRSASASEEGTNDQLIAEADYPVARSLLMRCLRFPLYPSLTAKEVAIVERVLSSLP